MTGGQLLAFVVLVALFLAVAVAARSVDAGQVASERYERDSHAALLRELERHP